MKRVKDNNDLYDTFREIVKSSGARLIDDGTGSYELDIDDYALEIKGKDYVSFSDSLDDLIAHFQGRLDEFDEYVGKNYKQVGEKNGEPVYMKNEYYKYGGEEKDKITESELFSKFENIRDTLLAIKGTLEEYAYNGRFADSKQRNRSNMKRVKDSFENTEFEQEYCSWDKKDRYRLLSRMQSDCDYYLGNGGKHAKHLWANDEEEHIKDMISLWNSFSADEKPEWLTYEELNDYSIALTGKSLDEWGVNNISDSRKIKDADETQDVLDGILMIAFNDGSEEEGYNEVKKHANEQGELDGVQYETYDVDIQDGVTLIDLCAATDDANAFVKALLTEWGIIDAVADIEFEKSELMENAEVSDSRRVKDDMPIDKLSRGEIGLEGYYKETLIGRDFHSAYINGLVNSFSVKDRSEQSNGTKVITLKNGVGEKMIIYTDNEDVITDLEFFSRKSNVSDSHKINDSFFDDNYGYTNDNEEGVEYNYAVFDFDECEMKDFQYESDAIDFCERNPYAASVMSYDGETIWIKGKGRVSDSRKVNDMTKPAHLRGYAEKYRKKRREQKESYKENEEEKQDKEVSDSRRVRDGFVTKYNVAYNEDPYKLARRIAQKGTVSVNSRHQRSHEENVNEDTIFHVYNDGDYKYNDFMSKYGVNDSKTIKNGSTMKSNRVSDSLEDDYEEYLNEIGEDLDEDEFIIGGEKRNMPYGTALRQYDPIAFNVGFDEWEREMEDDKEQFLGQIANQLEEGYHSGYDPQWDIDITVDNGMDISDFSDEDKDLIYQNIAYVVKDGYDNYMDIETELSDGSIVYVDFVLNY